MIIFDEMKYAENMLRNGFKTKNKIVYELNILTKYLYSKFENDSVVKGKLIEFCKKNIDHFNNDEWYNIINKTLSFAKKSKLITSKEVHITQKELSIITNIEDVREQKVAFVLLVLYKFYNYKKFEVVIEDLYRLCKMNINSKTKLKLLQSLTSKNLIDITMGGKRWVKFSDQDGETVITIKDFDDFIYEHMKYIGEEGFSGCEVCDKAIKLTNNKKKYCRSCALSKKNEQNKLYYNLGK